MLALYIIAGVILFIVLMLSIPVDMKFDLATNEHAKAKIRIGWLFGLVWKDIRTRKKKKPKEKPKKRRKRGIKSFLPLLRIKGLLGKILKLIRQILGCLKIKQLDVASRVGLDNPFDTGMLCSVLWPALIPPNPSGKVIFRLEPVFSEFAFEASLQGWVRLFPIQLVWTLVSFVLSPTGLRLLKLMVVSRWK
ncbi:MAG TPA: hypothetical protein G4N93_00250 [Dehalococcoidia bacterium]|nr:hypothetical protein [Dehalococcoidia bacterium]